MKFYLGFFLCIFIAGGNCEAQTAPASAADSSALPTLIKRLSSEQFSDREAAQRELEKLDHRALPELKRLAKSAKNDEAKARLEKFIGELSAKIATDPPAISLSLKNADWSAMATALGAATGIETKGGDMGEFTLEMKDKPYWEVVAALAKQHPMSIRGSLGRLKIEKDEKTLFSRLQIAGPFAFAPIKIERKSTTTFAGGENVKTVMKLCVWGGVDPRVGVGECSRPEITSVMDDKGNELFVRDEDEYDGMLADHGSSSWDREFVLKVPPKMGTKIVSVKGEMRVNIIISSVEMTIADPGSQVKKPFELGGRTITIQRYENREQHGVDIAWNAAALQHGHEQGADGIADYICLNLIDEAGEFAGSYVQTEHMSGGFGGGAKGKVKAQVIVATAMKLVTVPFEFKDLTIP